MNTAKSEALFNKAKEIIPGGVHSNSRYRSPHPLYFQKGDGAFIWDIDGNRYIDCVMGNGANILGYNDTEFNERMQDYLKSGIITGLETELSVKAAEKFLSIVQTAEQVRYTNSGTEAVMHSLMMARTFTGKQDIAVIEGAYNGWHDAVYVSAWPDLRLAGDARSPKPVPGSAGLSEAMVNSTLVLPFNDLERAEALLSENKDRIAALIIEPIMIDIGYIPAQKAYLEGLRKLCDDLNIVLIFDELLTGFRVAPGGAQEYYGVVPDLSTFGKAISNGYMLAAVAGKRSVLETVTPGKGPCAFVGTYNGHQVSLAASLAFLEIYEERHVFEVLCQRTERLISGFAETAKKHGIAGRIQGRGGHFHWYFTNEELLNYRDAARSDKALYARFQSELAARGVYTSSNYLQHHALSWAHDDAIVSELLFLMEESLAAAKV